jgi:hypothetical protein
VQPDNNHYVQTDITVSYCHVQNWTSDSAQNYSSVLHKINSMTSHNTDFMSDSMDLHNIDSKALRKTDSTVKSRTYPTAAHKTSSFLRLRTKLILWFCTKLIYGFALNWFMALHWTDLWLCTKLTIALRKTDPTLKNITYPTATHKTKPFLRLCANWSLMKITAVSFLSNFTVNF